MTDQFQCPDCHTTPQEPHTARRYGGTLRVFCERCQRWFALVENQEPLVAKGAASKTRS